MTVAKPLNLHLISDSTGNTLISAARAVVIRFDPGSMVEHRHIFVRSLAKVTEILDGIEQPAIILHTVVDGALRDHLDHELANRNLEALALLDPVVERISAMTGATPRARPGQQYKIDDSYHDRIAAIDYAVGHDDGMVADRLLAADVILVGVSRTSKTPTCIYLGYQGVKAANIPLTGKTDLLHPLIAAMEAGIPVIGLIASPSRLAQVRAQRLHVLDRGEPGNYADIAKVREEVAQARLFFDRYDIPTIDVTRRSIEETAAAILEQIKGPNRA